MGNARPKVKLNRRGFLALAATALASGSAHAQVNSLSASAGLSGRLFGSEFDVEDMALPNRVALTTQQCRIITPGRSLKFDWIRPRETVADFSRADRIIGFAERQNLLVRGHTLIWNDWTPDWLNRLPSQRIAYWLDRHIDEVVGRYAGRIQSWDVVNEAFFPPQGEIGGFRKGPWFRAMGPDYIRRAFARASALDAHAKLTLNESGAEWAWSYGPTVDNRRGVLRLIDQIRDAGARIDAVGLECHWVDAVRFDAGLLTDFLGQLGEKKVDVYITEADVEDASFPDDVRIRDADVAARYATLLAVALKAPCVKSVLTWGLSDPQSWLYEAFRPKPGSSRRARPLPFDAQCGSKPAAKAIAAAFLAASH